MTKPDIRFVPLSDIYVDYQWNGRSYHDVVSGESDAVQDTTAKGEHQALGAGFVGLCHTMETRGQDTPVIIRAVLHNSTLRGIHTLLPFELVAGFRRVTAAQKIKIANVPQGQILAWERVLSPLEATILNGRENTDRQNLSSPDMMFLCAKLERLGLTQAQISRELGIVQTYVSKLLAISRLPDAILEHWRGGTSLPGLRPIVHRRVRVDDMSSLIKRAAEQRMLAHDVVEAYKHVLENPVARATKPAPGAARIPQARVEEAFATLSGIAQTLAMDDTPDDEKLVRIKMLIGAMKK